VAAGWGDPVEFAPAKVVASSKAADKLYVIRLDAGSAVARGYTRGGQYVQVLWCIWCVERSVPLKAV
jgi:hypothetical protein